MYHLPFQNSFNAIIMCSMAQATLVITWALCDICVILGTMTSWKKWIDFVKSKFYSYENIEDEIAHNLNWIQNLKLNFNTFNSKERIEMQIGTKDIENFIHDFIIFNFIYL